MGWRWRVREERTQQQALPQGDPGGHRQVATMVAADHHHGRQSSGQSGQPEEAGELGRQRHPEPGVQQQVQAGLCHQRVQERHCQALEQEGRDAAAAAVAHGHLAHTTTRYNAFSRVE